MTDKKTLGARLGEYRPSKTTLFWSCAAVAVVTTIVGFTWGGWVTGGTAQTMVQEARRNLAASFCVQRFLSASDAASEHDALMKEGSWHRHEFIQKGGWANMPKLAQPISGVADLCAEKLADIEISPATAQSKSDGESTTTTVQ
jgi:hypothetical protein